MKRFLAIIALVLSTLLLLSISACSTAKSDGYGGGYGHGMAGGAEVAPGADGAGDMGDIAVGGGEAVDSSDKQEIQIAPGQLTACAYNDNEHFEFWRGLIGQDGEFNSYYAFAFKTYNRIKLQLTKGVYARVDLLGENGVIHTAVSDANGVCYLFSEKYSEEYKIRITTFNKGEEVQSERTITGDSEIEVSGDGFERVVQIMFVIDATGSMGDEMAYLNSEITDVINKVLSANQGYVVELAIMVYRDKGDDYVTRYSEFTTDANAQKEFLNRQGPNGGGDFPEAVQTALSEAAGVQYWKTKATKVLVHVADAPAHNEDVPTWKNAVHALSEKGVRIITVASSGINKQTEYFFRSQSMLTNGDYVYLTNHSGIGNDHLEATVEEQPVVEYLNSCLVRLINGYISGEFASPVFFGNDIQQ